MDYKYISKSVEDTLTIAENIESEKFPNMIICLNGELGSGKTIFTKGFARALGIADSITSPTFTIVKEYDAAELSLYHMDVYRLDKKCNVGIKDYFNKGGVTIIEWADIINDELPEERLEIIFKIIDEDTRALIFKPYGKVYEDICSAVL